MFILKSTSSASRAITAVGEKPAYGRPKLVHMSASTATTGQRFQLKMYWKPFVGRAPPVLAREATTLPVPPWIGRVGKEGKGGGKDGRRRTRREGSGEQTCILCTQCDILNPPLNSDFDDCTLLVNKWVQRSSGRVLDS